MSKIPAAQPSAKVDPPAGPDVNARHLRTDHLLDNLKKRTISSGVITGLTQGGKFLLTLGSTIVLARLLTPQDFGLLSIVMGVTGVLSVLRDGGLSTATLQKNELTQAQVSNLFWVNASIGVLLTVLVAAGAPVVSWFFRDERLTPITIALSFTFLATGLAVQHMALLRRQMRFKSVALVEIGSQFLSVGVAVVLALRGLGYWALVWSYLVLTLGALVLAWFASGWRPAWPARNSGTLSMLKFGASITGGSLAYYLSRNVDVLLIGRRFGPDAVGLYSRATALLIRPIEQLMFPVSSVFVPMLSRLQNDPERYRRTFLRVYDAMALVGFIATSILFALAYPVTVVLLGPQWEAAAGILAAFAIAALYMPLSSTANWLLTTQARGRDILVGNITNSSLGVAALVAGLPFGPLVMAVIWSVSGLCLRVPYLFYLAGRSGPVRTGDLWGGFFRHVPVWFVTFGATWVARWSTRDLIPAWQLIIGVAVGLVFAGLAVAVFPGSRRTAVAILSTARDSLPQRALRFVPRGLRVSAA